MVANITIPVGLSHFTAAIGVLDGIEVIPRNREDQLRIECNPMFTPYRQDAFQLRHESNCPNCGAPVRYRACQYCGTSHTVRSR